MDSKRKAFFDRIFGKNFWDFRKNQYYFYYLDGSKVYFKNNVWYWDNRLRYWFKYLDSGKRIISRDDASDWVNDWEDDVDHIDQVTSNSSDSIDLLK